MLSIAIDICKTIIEKLQREEDLKFDTKIRLSGVFSNISEILLDTAQKLKSDEYPHYNCVLLEKLSDKLHFYLIDLVDANELDNLHSLLKESSHIEKSFALRKEADTIPNIERAAGEFKSMSILLGI